MSRYFLLVVLFILTLPACNAAMMQGFQQGYQGQYYQPQPLPTTLTPRGVPQTRQTYGYIYTPGGQVMPYNATSY